MVEKIYGHRFRILAKFHLSYAQYRWDLLHRQLQKKHPCGAFFVTDGVVGFEP